MDYKKFLITGGAGLIGSHIADQLVKEGAHEIIILDNFSRGRKENLEWALENGPVKVINGDIRNREILNNLFKSIDVIFHDSAIRITQCAEEPRLALEVLADGTFNILEAAAITGVKKIIAASSASIYGMAEDFPTSENHHPYNNITIYGASKLFNESLLRCFKDMYNLDYIGLRYFNVYGPRMDIFGVYTEVIVKWIERIHQKTPPIIFGDGSQTMDLVYVEDVARANILAAKSDITDEIFNIGTGTEISLNELANLLLSIMDSDLIIEYRPERKVNPVRRRLADIKKSQQLLGFKPQVSLKNGLRIFVDWWLKENKQI